MGCRRCRCAVFVLARPVRHVHLHDQRKGCALWPCVNGLPRCSKQKRTGREGHRKCTLRHPACSCASRDSAPHQLPAAQGRLTTATASAPAVLVRPLTCSMTVGNGSPPGAPCKRSACGPSAARAGCSGHGCKAQCLPDLADVGARGWGHPAWRPQPRAHAPCRSTLHQTTHPHPCKPLAHTLPHACMVACRALRRARRRCTCRRGATRCRSCLPLHSTWRAWTPTASWWVVNWLRDPITFVMVNSIRLGALEPCINALQAAHVLWPWGQHKLAM